MTLPTTPASLEVIASNTPLIDVRAPVEFAQGSLPGAVNLPLMVDEERHQVGIAYKQQGQQAAIALGERLVSGEIKQARVAAWQAYLAQHPDASIYCFRGGLRSQIAQQWLVDATRTLAVSGGVFVAVLLAGPSLVWAVDEWRDYRVPWRYMLFGMAVFGMALSVILPLLAAAGVSVPGVTPAVAAVFTGPVARFAWMGAPLLTAVVVRKI